MSEEARRLGSRVVNSGLWVFSLRIATRLLRFFAPLLLARSPEPDPYAKVAGVCSRLAPAPISIPYLVWKASDPARWQKAKDHLA